MEETNKSTATAEGNDMDQKLPATTPTRSSKKGSAKKKYERDAKRKAGQSGSSVPGAQALNGAGERRVKEKSDRNAKRFAPTSPGTYSATGSSPGSKSKGRKDRCGDKASRYRPSRPERDEKAAAQGTKPTVPGV
jgi:hypothetical protein